MDKKHLLRWNPDTPLHTHTHTEGNFKRVSTSHIPPVSQPAALFVDQRTDNKSFYRLSLPPSTPPLPSVPPFSDTLSSSRSSSPDEYFPHHLGRRPLCSIYVSLLSLSLSALPPLPLPLFALLSPPSPLFLSPTPPLSRCGGSCCSCFHFPSSLVRGNQRFCLCR